MVYIGADHRGFELKEKVKEYLLAKTIEHIDCGAQNFVPDDDYPVYAEKVARCLKQGDKGILICGSGHGVCVAANKVSGIRASLSNSEESAVSGRKDDDLNVLCLSADLTPPDKALNIVNAFLATPFSREERHQRRLKELEELEKRNG